MNVIYVANTRLPTEKAHGYQIMKMCEALASQGCVVELVVPRRKRFIVKDPFSYWVVARIFRIIELPTTDFISGNTVPRKIAFLIDAASFAFQAFRYTRKKRDINAVFARDREIAFLSLIVKTTMIFEVHFLPRMMRLYRFLWRNIYAIITITHGLKVLLKNADFDERRIAVLPDGVDLNVFKNLPPKAKLRKELGISDDQFIVLYAGQLFSWKGIQTLIASAKKLPKENAVFIIGGSGTDIQKLKSEASNNVVFVGHVLPQQVPKWLCVADILVLPNSARFDISKYYTSPLKLFEYMASGVPIVASDLPSLREILNERNAFFFEPDNAVSLADTLIAVRNNYVEAEKRAKRARDEVRRYTWERRAEHICAILRNI
ncbi:hypothetical protein A3J56_02260 [Candidatus Giovannonibacteria bacterium RIFCSPHIGHO2_02_FULL_46_20]|uniref:Glycosyltransferase subfamily 4-like N-terminal domain-containing protein n=1 Tax=Candidatus Giovannonibacteria bacterium RIFCSPHIGHO2_02_FULL_46_20 TaxID=1798338 RepID=A0A1F5WFX9_9BACT|nr:MAG: hypothetical protein A3J56_02260 [Candidatus Giovannonibacteria bacterium RIFCSPHIGHO2_02_FULL_46_20]